MCVPCILFIHTYASEASLLKHIIPPAIMRPLWHTFESSLQVYLRSSIEGAEDSYDGRYDSDGEEKSLDTFVIQVTYHFQLSRFFFLHGLNIEVNLLVRAGAFGS